MASYFRPKLIPQEQTIKKPFYTGLASLLVTSILLGIFWQKLPPQVPLFYSKPWGEQQLASPFFLALPILICLFFLVISSILNQLLNDYPFVKKILTYGATCASILASITIIRIIFLIT